MQEKDRQNTNAEEEMKTENMEVEPTTILGKRKMEESNLDSENALKNSRRLSIEEKSYSTTNLPSTLQVTRNLQEQKSLSDLRLPSLITAYSEKDDFIPLPTTLDQSHNINEVNLRCCLRAISNTGKQFYDLGQNSNEKLINLENGSVIDDRGYSYAILWNQKEKTLQFRMKIEGHIYLVLDERKLANRLKEALIDKRISKLEDELRELEKTVANEQGSEKKIAMQSLKAFTQNEKDRLKNLDLITLVKDARKEKYALTAEELQAIQIDDLMADDQHLPVLAAGFVFVKGGMLGKKITLKAGAFFPKNQEQLESAKAAINSFAFLRGFTITSKLDKAEKLEKKYPSKPNAEETELTQETEITPTQQTETTPFNLKR